MADVYGVWRAIVQRGVKVIFALFLFSGPASAIESKTLLILGDSLAAGYGFAAEQGWVNLTAQRLQDKHPHWRVVNASISGETTAGGASRISAELQRYRPALVVIELGANDGLRGLPLAQVRSNLDRIIRAAKDSKARVLLIGMRLPPNYGNDYTQGFERLYVELSKQHEIALLPFLLEPIAGDRNAFQPDNLHPVAAVQSRLRDHVWNALKPLLP